MPSVRDSWLGGWEREGGSKIEVESTCSNSTHWQACDGKLVEITSRLEFGYQQKQVIIGREELQQLKEEVNVQ